MSDTVWRARVPDNCFPDLGLYVVNSEHLKDSEAHSQRSELTDDLAAA